MATSKQSPKPLTLDGQSLTLQACADFMQGYPADGQNRSNLPIPTVAIAKRVRSKIRQGERFVSQMLQAGKPVYGVNTGFGDLASVRIADNKLNELQRNLIRSHCCGVGEPLPKTTVRLAMLLRINSLVQGHSGIRETTLDTLVAILNADIVPRVPRRGSVGASGDLAPLAHMALTAIGEGQAYYRGEEMAAAQALKKAKIAPISLQAKEGLALINGTQVIQAIGVGALVGAERWLKAADIAAAMSLEALRGSDSPFDARVAALRPHPGHALVSQNMRTLLAGSAIRKSHLTQDPRVQDAYSLRCVPQVHGACRDGWQWVATTFERELNAVTDNPLLFPQDGDVISAGNFHGEPLAMALDQLGILLASLASISERRIESMVNHDISGLPPFLVQDSGLHSGMMMAQVTAAALASENKIYAHPASVDSIPTSANKEDYVSMGLAAALKAETILSNTSYVLAIEILAAFFAIPYHNPLKTSRLLQKALAALGDIIEPLEHDRVLSDDIENVRMQIEAGAWDPIARRLA